MITTQHIASNHPPSKLTFYNNHDMMLNNIQSAVKNSKRRAERRRDDSPHELNSQFVANNKGLQTLLPILAK